MWINTGSKDFWLGALFFVIVIDSVLKILRGIEGKEKSNKYSWKDSADGLILLIISLGWWFGS